MNNTQKTTILTIIFLFFVGAIIGLSVAIYSNDTDSKTYTIKNNSTRNYEFEHYCDSVYESDPDYYLDILVETDEFQNYIEEHGQWWTN